MQCKKEKVFNDFHSSQKRRIASHNKTRLKCKECLCRECKSCRKREPPRGGEAPTGDYYCIACPHQKCATCKTMKPLAAFSPVEGERKARHERYVCTQCKSAVRKKCAECKTEKEIASRSTRCNDCQFPSCAVCKHQCKESEGAVRLEQKVAATVWYCAKCNDQAKTSKACTQCGITKDPVDFKYDKFHEVTRCLLCTHPTCVNCSHQHPRTERAVEAKSWVGGAWYCQRTQACIPEQVTAASR